MALQGALAEAVRKGWVIEFGNVALDGTNPKSVDTNVLIEGAMVSLKTKATPGVATSVVTWYVETATPAQLDIYGWKVTNSSTTTMIAATGSETVTWIVWGPKLGG